MDFNFIDRDSSFSADGWESITDQPPNPYPYSPAFEDYDNDDDDDWIRDPNFDALDRVVIM